MPPPQDVLDWQQQDADIRRPLSPSTETPASAPTPSFTTAAGATATGRITLPAGMSVLRLLATASGFLFAWSCLVTGHQTVGQYFGDPGAPGSPLPVAVPSAPLTVSVMRDWDTQIDFTAVGDPSRALNYFVSALTRPEAPGQAGNAQSVQEVRPAPWQAPQLPPVRVSTAIAAGANSVLLAAAGVARIYVFTIPLGLDAAVAGGDLSLDGTVSGTKYASWNQTTTVPAPYDGRGAPTSAGDGLQLHNNNGAAAITVRGAAHFSQSTA